MSDFIDRLTRAIVQRSEGTDVDVAGLAALDRSVQQSKRRVFFSWITTDGLAVAKACWRKYFDSDPPV